MVSNDSASHIEAHYRIFAYVTIMRHLWRHTRQYDVIKFSIVLCISLYIWNKMGAFHVILPFHKLYVYKTTHTHSKLRSQLLKTTKSKMPEKSQKQNKLTTVHFTTYYSSKNYTFTKRHQSIKNYVPSCSKWLSQKCQRKAKTKTNLQQCISLHITLSQITIYKTILKH